MRFFAALLVVSLTGPAAAQQYQDPNQQAALARAQQICANALAYSNMQGFAGDLARARLRTCIAQGIIAPPPQPQSQSTYVQCQPNGDGSAICNTTTQ